MTDFVSVDASCFRPRPFFRDITDMSPLARFGFSQTLFPIDPGETRGHELSAIRNDGSSRLRSDGA
jgi:hypothetical protein